MIRKAIREQSITTERGPPRDEHAPLTDSTPTCVVSARHQQWTNPAQKP